MTIAAGRDALMASKMFHAFLNSLGATPRRGVPVAPSAPESPREVQAQ